MTMTTTSDLHPWHWPSSSLSLGKGPPSSETRVRLGKAASLRTVGVSQLSLDHKAHLLLKIQSICAAEFIEFEFQSGSGAGQWEQPRGTQVWGMQMSMV